ncbi:MAG: DUF1365 domain-containing protein [Candidatus Brocadiae bacterium]|nr:DUF1365 domain-containing protein [Candidatus Brocadiia bacterium]
MVEPGLYLGTLRHRRFHPRRHAFTYTLGMAFLDVDRIPELCAASPWVSSNRFNWASFDDRDHVGDPGIPLRERLRASAAAAGLELPNGRIFLLTHLRYLGYCFNPVTFFYCYEGDRLALVMAEINNTFGERAPAWMGPAQALPGRPHSYRFPKTFHVSPFVSMNCVYRFSFVPPSDTLDVRVAEWEDGRFFFDATLQLTRRPWRHSEISSFLAQHPWMTAKVIGAIHWEALRLWLKRCPVWTHPRKLGQPGPGGSTGSPAGRS